MLATLRRADHLLLGAVLALLAVGILFIYSATGVDSGGSTFVRKQALGGAVGLGVLVALLLTDYRLLRRFARPVALAGLGLLVAVFVVGVERKGAQRWIPLPGGFQLQPSEFVKVAFILALAAFIARRHEKPAGARKGLGGEDIVWSLALLALPALLIMKQPDLGTALVLVAIWFGAMFMCGARGRHLLAVAALFAVIFAVAWNVGLVHDYQKSRLLVFLNPEGTHSEAGYQIVQSRIAIGSGQLTGRGLFRGSQGRLDYVPEDHTDFIFTKVGEEAGFVGSCLILALYALVLWRGARAVALAEDEFGRAIAAGVTTMLLFHVAVNVGMTVGLMPVTGVPLPLLSYGVSSLLANLAAVGLLLSVHAHRHDLQFGA
jgi:rod shape determining protein RodA